ncbi:MAG: hypothetical protein ABSC14_00680 [Desulfomonilia bacterium]
MNTLDNQNQLARLSAKIIGETIRATGTRTFLSAVVKELIDEWAKKGGFRGKIASPVNWIISKVLQPGKNWNGTGISADVGRFLTAWAKKINTDHAADPLCHARARGDTIHNFLNNTDFGEIREMVEGSGPCVIKTIEAFNEQLWKYPAKVGTLVATIIPLMNTFIKASREILIPIEEKIGPDLLADIMLSMVRGINGANTAKLINAVREVIRRVHTGSLLLGKGGKPLFQIYLTDLLHDCLPEMDPELVKKIRIIFAEDREAMANAMADALSDNPDITLSYLASMGLVKTSDIKARTRRLGIIEQIDPVGLKSAVSEGMSDLDTYEIAGLVNTACRVANRIHEVKPDILSNALSGVVDSVSPEEVRKTARWLIPDLVNAIKPLAVEMMPFIIKGFSELISPDDGFASPEHKEAMASLKTALAAGSRG